MVFNSVEEGWWVFEYFKVMNVLTMDFALVAEYLRASAALVPAPKSTQDDWLTTFRGCWSNYLHMTRDTSSLSKSSIIWSMTCNDRMNERNSGTLYAIRDFPF